MEMPKCPDMLTVAIISMADVILITEQIRRAGLEKTIQDLQHAVEGIDNSDAPTNEGIWRGFIHSLEKLRDIRIAHQNREKDERGF